MARSKPNYAPDFFDRLGIPATHDALLIRRQYRLLARLYHPDVNTSDESQQRFIALQEAYNVLGDEQKRRDYLRWLEAETVVRRPLQMGVRLYPSTLLRAAGKQRVYALLELNADKSAEIGTVPLNVVIVLDRSSSMKGRRLHYVKQAARRILDNLSPQDYFGIVTFNDRASVALPIGPAGDMGVAKGAIESILAAGGTELATGLRMGVQEVLRYHSPRVLSHVILLTDGRTYGDEAIALDLASKAGEEQIGVTAMGLGTDWNDEFLDDLAQRTNGSSHFIAEPDEAVELFHSQLQQLQRTFARNARLALELGPEVKLLSAYEVGPGLRALGENEGELVLGSLPAEPPLRLLLDFAVPLPVRDVALLARFSLKAQLVQDSMLYRVERLAVTDVSDTLPEPPAPELYEAARRVATLRMQNRTWESLAAGMSEQTAAALSDLANRFLELGAHDLALATQREMEIFQRTGNLSDRGRMTIKYGTRHLALPAPNEEAQP